MTETKRNQLMGLLLVLGVVVWLYPPTNEQVNQWIVVGIIYFIAKDIGS